MNRIVLSAFDYSEVGYDHQQGRSEHERSAENQGVLTRSALIMGKAGVQVAIADSKGQAQLKRVTIARECG